MKQPQPARQQTDLAEMVEMLLDKGVVVNADITISIGQTEFIGVQLRAAIASFDTAARYGLEFPEGTDQQKLNEAAGLPARSAVQDEDQQSLAEALEVGLEVENDDGD